MNGTERPARAGRLRGPLLDLGGLLPRLVRSTARVIQR